MEFTDKNDLITRRGLLGLTALSALALTACGPNNKSIPIGTSPQPLVGNETINIDDVSFAIKLVKTRLDFPDKAVALPANLTQLYRSLTQYTIRDLNRTSLSSSGAAQVDAKAVYLEACNTLNLKPIESGDFAKELKSVMVNKLPKTLAQFGYGVFIEPGVVDPAGRYHVLLMFFKVDATSDLGIKTSRSTEILAKVRSISILPDGTTMEKTLNAKTAYGSIFIAEDSVNRNYQGFIQSKKAAGNDTRTDTDANSLPLVSSPVSGNLANAFEDGEVRALQYLPADLSLTDYRGTIVMHESGHLMTLTKSGFESFSTFNDPSLTPTQNAMLEAVFTELFAFRTEIIASQDPTLSIGRIMKYASKELDPKAVHTPETIAGLIFAATLAENLKAFVKRANPTLDDTKIDFIGSVAIQRPEIVKALTQSSMEQFSSDMTVREMVKKLALAAFKSQAKQKDLK